MPSNRLQLLMKSYHMYNLHCVPKKWAPKHFATATANLLRFKWNFTYTRHLFLSSTPSFTRIPYSVWDFQFFQTAVPNLSYRYDFLPCWRHLLLHLLAGECPSPLCPWDSCATVSWDTRLHQPTGLATKQSRSQSGGLCDLGHSAGTSLPLPDPWLRPSERMTDWRVASFWSKHISSESVSWSLHKSVRAKGGTLRTSDLNMLTVLTDINCAGNSWLVGIAI